jgi:hypothetical protein
MKNKKQDSQRESELNAIIPHVSYLHAKSLILSFTEAIELAVQENKPNVGKIARNAYERYDLYMQLVKNVYERYGVSLMPDISDPDYREMQNQYFISYDEMLQLLNDAIKSKLKAQGTIL